MENLSIIAKVDIGSGILSLLFLLILHVVSPEFKPAWRMVSEYALGKYKWLLSAFFIFWSIDNLLAAVLYLNLGTSRWTDFAAAVVFISGLGAFMGAVFDMRHKLHALSFFLGVPMFPIAALIIAFQLSAQSHFAANKNLLWIFAHLVWLSLVFMGISMALFFSGLKKANVPFGPNEKPLSDIPKNVIAVNGYANRLLVFLYIAFNIAMALVYLMN